MTGESFTPAAPVYGAGDFDMRRCSACNGEARTLWNGGRCLPCHEARCAFPLTGAVAPAGFDPMAAGERWGDNE